MQLETIVTLASPEVRLRFVAMERSLRATGCDLPLRVIPYGMSRFDLPPNAEWWLDAEITDWLQTWKAHPMMRKYQCLTIPNFQFVDSDVIFLRNPEDVLLSMAGFVTSCGHWKNPDGTLTARSISYFAQRSTNWQQLVFNAGQWACDRALYTRQALRERCESSDYKETCLTFAYNDQPGVNFLVNSTEVPIHNLTLPPWNMQSTWAGDYPADFRHYWNTTNQTPYLIHWAGCRMEQRRPIDELMEHFLSAGELRAWKIEIEHKARSRRTYACSFHSLVSRVKRMGKSLGQWLESTASSLWPK